LSIPSSTRAWLRMKQKAEAITKNTNPNPPFAATLPLSQLCTAGSLLRPLSFTPALGERRKERDDDDPRQSSSKNPRFPNFIHRGSFITLLIYPQSRSSSIFFIHLLSRLSSSSITVASTNVRPSARSSVRPSTHLLSSSMFFNAPRSSLILIHSHGLNKRSSFNSSVHPYPSFIHVLRWSAFILHPHPFPSPQQTSVLQFVRPSVHPQSSSIFFHRFTFILLFFRACSLTSLFNKLSYSRDLSLNGVFLMRERR